MTPSLPAAARPLVAFSGLLRAHGFAVAPEQTTAFLTAVGLLGPRGMADIRAAALATLAPPPERRPDFDALFAAHFLGRTLVAPAEADADDEETRLADGDARTDPPEAAAQNESGAAAARAEALGLRAFAALSADEALRRLRRDAPKRLPRRRSRRRAPARRGDAPDFRRTLREAMRRDGETLTLPRRRRRERLRRLCLLIDVSGSMKARTEAHLRVAHALTQAAPSAVETFTLGTRLTRVTRAMRVAQPARALARAAGMVADWDGGTRLGEALAAFLAVPRFLATARGAAVLALSDGLERGAPDALVAAVARLRRAAWRLVWLTPLAAAPGWRPETAAMRAILPHLDALLPAADTPTLCAQALALRTAAGSAR